MNVGGALRRLAGRGTVERVVVREYGRDSVLIWANLLLAPLMAALGLRVGIRSEEQVAAMIEADTASMRKKGYRVASVQTFSLPVIGSSDRTASWYRVTFELASPPSA